MAAHVLVIFLFLFSLTHGTNTTCPSVAKCLKSLTRGSSCPNLLPVPARSRIPQVAPANFTLTPLRQGVFLFSDGFYLSLVLHRHRHLVLLDLPDQTFAPTTIFVDVAKQVLNGTIPTRVDIVYSHPHYDHIGGATRFVDWLKTAYPCAKLRVWGTARAGEVIARSVTKRAVPPTVLIESSGATIRLGHGLNVRIHVIGGHTPDNLAIHIPPSKHERGILMHMDVVFPRWSPPFNLAITRDVGEYIEVTRKLLEFEFDTFIGGHNVVGSRDDVKEAGRFVQSLLTAARKAAREVDNEVLMKAGIARIFDPRAVEFGNVWWVFARVLRELQIDICYRDIVEEWGCRLAGVDIFGRGLCLVMLQYLLVEF